VTKVDVSNAGLKLLFSFCVLLTVVTCFYYPGQVLFYVAFSILVNALLFLGLRRDSIFFDLFIGGLFWLGYWLKFSVRTTFMGGRFHEAVGNFDYSAAAYDHALAVVSCGIGALLLVRLLRARFIFCYPGKAGLNGLDGLCESYQRRKTLLWIAFCVLILVLAISNFYFGIYQRGLAPRTILPYNLGSIYTWLLLFGAASISALMLDFEIRLHRAIPYVLFLLVLLEIFASNASMISRGMILNTGALLAGIYVVFRMRNIAFKLRPMVASAMTVFVLFAASIALVNSVRQHEMYAERASEVKIRAARLAVDSNQLFLDRWVGIDGAVAVSSYPHLGWDLFKEAWGERYLDHGTTLYDLKIAKSVSKERYEWLVENDKHFITLPGIVAFLFYPGSFVFLFVSMMVVGAIGAGIEVAVYKLSSSLILCSLIAFVVAYRFAHFGYVPARSYLLFGAIALNVALIYLANRLLVARIADRNALTR
jgi:hypothetical protein